MPKGDKYINLSKYLEKLNLPRVILSFDEIERIIGDSLPDSSIRHAEAWWSNNKDHSQAISWLEAGYETECVSDTYKEKKIIFVKAE